MDPPWIDGPAHWGDPEYEKAMSKCEHDKRFSGVFLLDPVDNGCVACAFERKAAAVEQMQRAGWRACIDHIITPASDCPVCRVEELEGQSRILHKNFAALHGFATEEGSSMDLGEFARHFPRTWNAIITNQPTTFELPDD